MMDLFLNITCQFLTMGLPAIDQSLDELLVAMQEFPKAEFFGTTLTMAKALGLMLALCVGGYESWMMMLGRRGMDVLKLCRIVGLSFCITFSSDICNALSAPGLALENGSRTMTKIKNAEVAAKELEVAKYQKKYLDKLKVVQDSLQRAKEIQTIGSNANVFDKVGYAMSNMGSVIEDNLKQLAVVVESKVSEWINDVIRFIGELIFQMSYYGMFLAQRCFMTILGIFCPISFALSIVPPWGSAWSQWISKYISISLWGVVIYICIYFTDFIILYSLEKDILAYTTLINNANNSIGQIGAFGIQGIGTTCFYTMAMLVGAFLLKFVPEVSSWLIPGGASSSIGSAMGGAATGAVAGAASGGVAAASIIGQGGAHAAGGMASGAISGASVGISNAQSAGQGTVGQMVSGAVSGMAGAVGGGISSTLKGAGSGIANSKIGEAAKKGYKRGV